MRSYKILALTDHSKHSDQNSIYAIVSNLAQRSECTHIDVASRDYSKNKAFFDGDFSAELFALRADEHFAFDATGAMFDRSQACKLSDYDIVLMRLPRPIEDSFLKDLKENYPGIYFVNDPIGILETSNKTFLLNFKALCPAIKLCHSVEDVLGFSKEYDLVLKPLKEYGGKGILKIQGNTLNDGSRDHELLPYLESMKEDIETNGYLAMEFLKNVRQGDKRLLVVEGEVLASSLRLPPNGAWLCNVSQGGTSVLSEPDADELELVDKIQSVMKHYGVLIYGVDTLVDNSGKRVLSEINTMSIGGFMQAQEQTGKPVIKILLDKIFKNAAVELEN